MAEPLPSLYVGPMRILAVLLLLLAVALCRSADASQGKAMLERLKKNRGQIRQPEPVVADVIGNEAPPSPPPAAPLDDEEERIRREMEEKFLAEAEEAGPDALPR